MIKSKISTYYDNKLKPYQGRMIAAFAALIVGLGTASISGWIYYAMAIGVIGVAGAAVSIPCIIIMAAVIAICIYLVGVNADHHHHHRENHELHKHGQHHADHAHDSTHATVQNTLNANPTTAKNTEITEDVTPPENPLRTESSSSSGSVELESFYDHALTVGENRGASPGLE